MQREPVFLCFGFLLPCQRCPADRAFLLPNFRCCVRIKAKGRDSVKKRLRDEILRDAIRANDENDGSFLASCQNSPERLAALEYWGAKNCLKLTRTMGGTIVFMTVTPRGRTYFDDRRDARAAFWRERCVNFFGGFVSGVLTTLCAAWLIQRLL